MRKFMLILVITLLIVPSAHARIRTNNVDAEDYGSGDSKFDYKVSYVFATKNITQGNGMTVSIDATETSNTAYAMPFKGNIVGISIASSAALTKGSATAEVTINGKVTGVRTAIDFPGNTRANQSGLVTAHSQYNVQTINYDTDSVPGNWGGDWQGISYPYGEASALEVGDRLGVNLQLSNSHAPVASADLIITVIILQ